jgi:alkanesulfonate monooxygenase SsuD/methylene tetrahydromethanopterin reductase-like flavin-dependent oxidoreductase (luciferase family)
MELRIFTEPQQGATYDDLARVAQEAERLGFSAFFRSDHYSKMGSVSGYLDRLTRGSRWRRSRAKRQPFD